MESNLKDYILAEADKGNLVFAGIDDLFVVPINEFIKQPINGILYDLNRSPEVILTFINDPKWVNDYAVYLTIKKLKEENERLKKKKNK